MWRVSALALAILLTPALAQAEWLPGGNRIDGGGGFVAVASGPGRVVVAWVRQAGPGNTEVRAQAWTADGELPSGWPSAGVLVSDLPGTNHRPAIYEDGAGGVFVAWVNERGTDRSYYLQHVSATGSLAAGWAAEGLRLDSVSDYASALVAAHDGAGGVLVGSVEHRWDSPPSSRALIQRIDAAGRRAAEWPVGGYSIANAYDLGLAVDGEHHVFVSTAEVDPVEGRLGGLRVQRLDGSAVPDPGWPQMGALLPYPGSPAGILLFPDGTGGVFANWGEGLICLECDTPLISVARVLSDGTEDDGWIPRPGANSIAPDGMGGMLLGRVIGGRPGALRLDAGGAVMPGWAPAGNAATTEVVEVTPLVTADGEGGAFVSWVDYRTDEGQLYASRLDAQGRLADGWPATGSVVGTRGNSVVHVQLVSVGAGVAVALWEEWAPEGFTGYLLALRPGEPGPIARLRPVSIEVGFGVVHVRPNPARGPIVAIVELPSLGPARIELVDAAGRMRESQDFFFQMPPISPLAYTTPSQARGAVYFNQARTLPPGVYWIRVTQGLRRASSQVVVLE